MTNTEHRDPTIRPIRLQLALLAITIGLLVVLIGIATYRVSQLPANPNAIGSEQAERYAGTPAEDGGPSSNSSRWHDTTADAPKMLTVKKAGRVYLDAVGPANAATAKLNDNVEGVTPMSTWRAEGRAAREKQRAFLDTLTHTAWPLQVQPHADGLATCVGGYVRYFDAIADSKTYADLPIPSDFCSATDSGQAGVMRSLLGLKADV